MKLPHAMLLASLLHLGGCAIIPSLEGDLNGQLDRYLESGEYGKALDTLTYVRKDHPDYARLTARRPQVEERARAYEQAQIRRAAEFTARGEWEQALDTYRRAISQLPHSTPLRSELQAFRRKQEHRIEELKVERLVARARWLERAVSLQESIVRVDSDDWVERYQLDRFKTEAVELASELTRIGNAALEKEQLGIAARTLPIAARLSSDPNAVNANDRLSHAEASQVEEQRRSQMKAMQRLRQRETTKTLAEFRAAQSAGDLRQARQLMLRLVEIDSENTEVQAERSQFEAQLDKVLGTHLEAAISLYGRGRFEEAVAHWQRVLAIDPHHEQARAGVERAERVMQKLKQLREKQGTATAP